MRETLTTTACGQLALIVLSGRRLLLVLRGPRRLLLLLLALLLDRWGRAVDGSCIMVPP
jgi:hypothetical protein